MGQHRQRVTADIVFTDMVNTSALGNCRRLVADSQTGSHEPVHRIIELLVMAVVLSFKLFSHAEHLMLNKLSRLVLAWRDGYEDLSILCNICLQLQSSGSVERTYQSSAPEGCTYQSSAPEGCTHQSSAPEGCTYQSSAPEGCTYP
ncbi:NBS-LRR type resistance protein [Cucumis melo var. makuwa]|uniref:NBS-LRR type resistance protein n=1 Tax=Cucumis melo var. makuwa TaxID=1194695 RepID=A0A5A7TII6_CUCMM|nr:NBS-LRR type resistance protein [Cucumis melo var. makuwa]